MTHHKRQSSQTNLKQKPIKLKNAYKKSQKSLAKEERE